MGKIGGFYEDWTRIVDPVGDCSILNILTYRNAMTFEIC